MVNMPQTKPNISHTNYLRTVILKMKKNVLNSWNDGNAFGLEGFFRKKLFTFQLQAITISKKILKI